MSAAARPIAPHESRADGSTTICSTGSSGSCLATAAACPAPVTTISRSGAASGASRSYVDCRRLRLVPVSGCRNFGLAARDSGHSLVPLPPAGMTTWKSGIAAFGSVTADILAGRPIAPFGNRR
jgi:hypothetical protein